jgi:hypothetical protein
MPMEREQLKIVFKSTETEKPLEQIIEELVHDTIKKVLTKYAATGYNIDIDKDK